MKYQKNPQYQEIELESISEFYEIIEEYNHYYHLPNENNYDPCLAFYRGQSNSGWNIEPSLSRKETPEFKAIKEFSQVEKKTSLFSTIAYLQHHQPGTRFIDFTTNPAVALYFACCDNPEISGAVYICQYLCHRAEWYTATVLSELAALEVNDKIFVEFLAQKVLEKHPEYTGKFEDLNSLAGSIISFLDHGFMVLPDKQSLYENIRMQRQEGSFYICGVQFDKELKSCDRFFSRAGKQMFDPHSVVIPSLLKDAKGLVKLIIPAKLKEEILAHLAAHKITHDFLFPD